MQAVEQHRGQDLGVSLGKELALSPLTQDGSLRDRQNVLGPLMTYVQMGGQAEIRPRRSACPPVWTYVIVASASEDKGHELFAVLRQVSWEYNSGCHWRRPWMSAQWIVINFSPGQPPWMGFSEYL